MSTTTDRAEGPSGSDRTSSLVVAANRGPASINIAADGTLVAGHAAGGLAPSLARALVGRGAMWIAAAISDAERQAAASGVVAGTSGEIGLDFIDLDEATVSGAYNVVANSTLWFLLHGMFDLVHRPVLDRRWHEAWDAYVTYNRAFAERIALRAAPGAVVVVHDYHLFLAGRDLAKLRPDLSTVHFTHTPFATPEELSVLPSAVVEQLLDGMCSYGALGFHTERWRERFLRGAIAAGHRPPVTFVAPLGSDPEQLIEETAAPAVAKAAASLAERTEGRRLIVRSDRLEPSKNLLRGFAAFAELLEQDASLASRVRFVARSYASRTGLPEYLAYRAEVEHAVERINERFEQVAGGPVIELSIGDDFAASLAAFMAADVLLVNPLRDGMNLVAKEGPIVNRQAGVLALSKEAGAFEELGEYALAVEPFDVSGTAGVLADALAMDLPERQRRAEGLARTSAAMPPGRWLDQLLEHATPTGAS